MESEFITNVSIEAVSISVKFTIFVKDSTDVVKLAKPLLKVSPVIFTI